MALIKCIECGKEFSDKASGCPNCGCPIELCTHIENPAGLIDAVATNVTEDVKSEEQAELEDNKNPTETEGMINSTGIFIKKKPITKIIVMILLIGILLVFGIYFVPKEIAYKTAIGNIENNSIEALDEFENLGTYRDSILLSKQLKKDVYDEAIKAYMKGDYLNASKSFLRLREYEDSAYYLTLIVVRVDPLLISSDTDNIDNDEVLKLMEEANYNQIPVTSIYKTGEALIRKIEFADTKDVLLNSSYLEVYLEGSWETNDGYYQYTVVNENGEKEIKFDKESEKLVYPKWNIVYNIPWVDGEFYKYESGIHWTGNYEEGWKQLFKFEIKSLNEINIYCYKNNKTYVMHRI